MRELNEEDVRRMQIPERYWMVRSSGIAGVAQGPGIPKSPLIDLLRSYVHRAAQSVARGDGLFLFGNNGVGKTSALVWVGMQMRMRGFTVLYVETAKLKEHKIERTVFDAQSTIWERAMDVDVLILDDLGKGVTDSRGFMQELLDELIRTRGAHLRPTLVSSNVEPKRLIAEDFVKKSTLAMMQETVAFLHVDGEDLRARERQAIASRLFGGGDE